MKTVLKVVAILLVVTALSACYTIDGPVAATSNPVGTKVGEASGVIYLGMFGNVEAGIRDAAKNGGITEISTVDFRINNLLGLITTFTTTVTGK